MKKTLFLLLALVLTVASSGRTEKAASCFMTHAWVAMGVVAAQPVSARAAAAKMAANFFIW